MANFILAAGDSMLTGDGVHLVILILLIVIAVLLLVPYVRRP